MVVAGGLSGAAALVDVVPPGHQGHIAGHLVRIIMTADPRVVQIPAQEVVAGTGGSGQRDRIVLCHDLSCDSTAAVAVEGNDGDCAGINKVADICIGEGTAGNGDFAVAVIGYRHIQPASSW